MQTLKLKPCWLPGETAVAPDLLNVDILSQNGYGEREFWHDKVHLRSSGTEEQEVTQL